MPTLRQHTSFGPGTYRGHKFDIDRLKRFAEGTNKAIAAGVPIPLLIKKHAPINASDADTQREAEIQGGGWLKKLDVDDKGNLAWEADVTPDTKAKVDSGELKYTSPEFRDHYQCEKAGTYEGPVVRHITFTPLPGNPHQSPIETIALEELGVFQFGEADKDGSVQFIESPHHKHLTKKGYKKTGTSANGWTHYYEHNSGKQAKIEFDHANDSVGTLHTTGDGQKWRKHTGLQYDEGDPEEDEDEDDIEEGSDLEDEDEEEEETESQHEEEESTLPNQNIAGYRKHAEASEAERKGTQHTELDDDDSVVKHGYKFGNQVKHRASYDHKDGHQIVVNENKATWEHIHNNGKTTGSGDLGDGSLHTHLSKFHGSQHAEFDKPAVVNTVISDQPESPPEETGKNPDMPPVATDKSKMKAILAGLAQKNIVLPSDFDFSSESAADILLASINSSIKAEQETEAKNSTEEDIEPVQESSMPFSEKDHDDRKTVLASFGYKHHDKYPAEYHHEGGHSVALHSNGAWSHLPKTKEHGNYKISNGTEKLIEHLRKFHGSQHEEVQFSEEELAAMTPKARTAIEAGIKALEVERQAKIEAEQKAIQYREQEIATKNNAARDKAVRIINAASIPPVLREKLITTYTTTQFNEGVEPPVFTAADVAKMVADAIPKDILAFIEKPKTEEADIPIGQDGKPIAQFFEHAELPAGHISEDRAKEIIAEKYGNAHNGDNGVFKRTSTISDMVAEANRMHPIGT